MENETCTQGFAGVEMDGVIVEVSTGWHCWTTISFVSTPPDGIGGTGDGGGGLSGGGGGGSGSSPPPVTSLQSDLKTMVKGTCTFKESDIKKLNEAFEEMLKDCFYAALNNYLLGKEVTLRNIGFGTSGQASVTSEGDLLFYDSS